MTTTDPTTRQSLHRVAHASAGAEQTSLSRYLDEVRQYPLLSGAEEIELAQTIETGVEAHQRLTSDASISPKTRCQLVELVHSGEAAKERFLAANLRLVVANARRYAPPSGVDLLDLIQEGNIGLVRAVEKFDWRKGFKFSTYATWWIRQAIGKALADKIRMVRIPSDIGANLNLVKESQIHLYQQLGRPPRAEELAETTGLTVSQVNAVLDAPETVSLHAPVGDNGAVLADFIEEDEVSTAATEVELGDIANRLRHAVVRLPPREGRIVALRYGLTDQVPRTFEYIGDEFGLTAERVRQLEKLALTRLRHPTFGLRESDFL